MQFVGNLARKNANLEVNLDLSMAQNSHSTHNLHHVVHKQEERDRILKPKGTFHGLKVHSRDMMHWLAGPFHYQKYPEVRSELRRYVVCPKTVDPL